MPAVALEKLSTLVPHSPAQAGSLSMPHIRSERLPQGLAGTKRTLDVMGAAVRGELPPDYSGYRDERNRQTALNVCGEVKGHDSVGEIKALFFYCRDRIAYRQDPIDTERVQDAQRTIQFGSGDCDDKCVLLATLLASIGHFPRFIVQSQNEREFDHVYVEVWNERSRRWIALDPTADGNHGMPRADIGWRNPAPVEWYYSIFDFGNV